MPRDCGFSLRPRIFLLQSTLEFTCEFCQLLFPDSRRAPPPPRPQRALRESQPPMTTTDPTLRLVPLDLEEAVVDGDTEFIASWLDDGEIASARTCTASAYGGRPVPTNASRQPYDHMSAAAALSSSLTSGARSVGKIDARLCGVAAGLTGDVDVVGAGLTGDVDVACTAPASAA